MSAWDEFADEAPQLLAELRQRFGAHRHKIMATVRADGSPRLCGTEAELLDDGLHLGAMPGTRRFADLRRDPRVAVHSGSDEPDAWSGDVRVDGVATEITGEAGLARFAAAHAGAATGGFELFRVAPVEVTSVRLTPERDGLLVETWRRGRGVTVRRR